MKCVVCGEIKDDYQFFKFRNKFNKEFFHAGIPQTDGVCWHCAAPYKCVGCGEVKAADQFRIGGRYCVDCRTVGITNLQVLSGVNQTETT